MGKISIEFEYLLAVLLLSMGMEKRYSLLVRRVFRYTNGHDRGIFTWTKGVAKGHIDMKSVRGVGVGFEDNVLPLIKKLHNHLRALDGKKQIEFD